MLNINQRIGKLREKGIKQKDVVQECARQGINTLPSMVNNVLHGRNKQGEKTMKIRSVILDLLDDPLITYNLFWGSDD